MMLEKNHQVSLQVEKRAFLAALPLQSIQARMAHSDVQHQPSLMQLEMS